MKRPTRLSELVGAGPGSLWLPEPTALAVESEAKARAAQLVDDAERSARELLAQAEVEADRIRGEAFTERRAAEAEARQAETSAGIVRDEFEQLSAAGPEAVARARATAETIVAEARSSAATLREDASATASRVRGAADTYAKGVLDEAERAKQRAQELVDEAKAEARRIVEGADGEAGDVVAAAKDAAAEAAAEASGTANADADRIRAEAEAAADALRAQARTAATRITSEASREAQAERARAAGAVRDAEAARTDVERLRVDLGKKLDRLRWRTNILGRVLPVVALLAAVALTASGEYHLYVWAGFGFFAAFGPVCIDAYVIAAFRRRREVGWAIGVMVLTNVTVHLLPLLPGGWMHIVIRVAVAGLAPVVLWRVHELLHDGSASRDADQPGEQTEALPTDVPAVLPAPVTEAVVTASREAPATPVRITSVPRKAPRASAKQAAPVLGSGSRDHVAAALELLREHNGDVSYRAATQALGCRYDTAKDALDEAKRQYAGGANVLTLPVQSGTTNAEEATPR
ncbi:hypothetical protein [Yinghuangia sp. YIM S09857]|uniref:hypothetical protein n=1 Tax=Yinghuangia sp. YIM S09857 TaxID=3436929 RepID=UPI003F53B6BB